MNYVGNYGCVMTDGLLDVLYFSAMSGSPIDNSSFSFSRVTFYFQRIGRPGAMGTATKNLHVVHSSSNMFRDHQYKLIWLAFVAS